MRNIKRGLAEFTLIVLIHLYFKIELIKAIVISIILTILLELLYICLMKISFVADMIDRIKNNIIKSNFDLINYFQFSYDANNNKLTLFSFNDKLKYLRKIKSLDELKCRTYSSERKEIKKLLNESIKQRKKEVNFQCRLINENFEEMWIYTKANIIYLNDRIRLVGSCIDITEFKEKEKEFTQKEKLHKRAIELSEDIIYEIDLNDGSVLFNGDLSSYGLEKITKISEWINIIHEDDIENFLSILDKKIKRKNEDSCSLEYRIVNNNNIQWINSIGKLEVDENGIPVRLYGSLWDITQIKEKEQELNYISQRDQTTGLYNRQYLKSYISEYINSSSEGKCRQGALILVDLDKFKYVNDCWGHDYGDIFLRIIADGFLKIIDKDDLLCRFGGDEFIIFISNYNDFGMIQSKVEELIKFFESPKNVNGKSIYTSASIGISLFPNDATDFKNLLKYADVAMYAAKSNGRNTYQFYNEKISNELTRIYEIEKGLRCALDNNEIYVEFQPKVILQDNRIQGFEALMRWKSKELGFVSPGEFIPIAENTKIILPISSFLLEEVFKRGSELKNIGYDNFKIAINLSEVQLREGNVVEEFKRLIDQYNLPASYIEVEITEGLLMQSFEHNIKILNNLKEIGISVALDDFGTGYSSLNYLTKLPIDVLKIDRTFLLDILNNDKSKYIVENIIQLSHKLGISVVAEGVEVKEQVEYLKDILCDGVQGYYFSKPTNFVMVKELMKKGYMLQ